MRISDWSSDVCSSDLGRAVARDGLAQAGRQGIDGAALDAGRRDHRLAADAFTGKRQRHRLQRLAGMTVAEHRSSEERRVGQACVSYVSTSVVAVSLKKTRNKQYQSV